MKELIINSKLIDKSDKELMDILTSLLFNKDMMLILFGKKSQYIKGYMYVYNIEEVIAGQKVTLITQNDVGKEKIGLSSENRVINIKNSEELKGVLK